MSSEFRYLGRPMNAPSKELDTFPAPAHVTLVRFSSEELTSFCPVTAQTDFYRVEIEYVPDAFCVESKSLKLYLWSFRDEQMFAEQLSAMIAQDLADVKTLNVRKTPGFFVNGKPLVKFGRQNLRDLIEAEIAEAY